ncbi:MAG: WbuC family cupin fold metalloprotein [Kiritimatiellales bacterium]|nr:WbuC family cupin fold metalloprotein [Kiritimatiellales bacterium]
MKRHKDHPMALKPASTQVTPIDDVLISSVVVASRESPRKRIIQPLHKEGAASLQRMLNAIQPGSYIRPHRHVPERAESIIVLSGAIQFFTFSEQGAVEQSLQLKAGSTQIGIDIEGGVWHSFAALEADTVLFEVKPGPYDPESDKEFARWAPEEYSPEVGDYLNQLMDCVTEA